MNEGKRIKELRNALKITQQVFADTIGLKRNTIANYEIGQVQPSERTLTDICREFRVNYLWLKEGKGDMFTTTPESVVDELAEDFKLDEIDKKIIEKYLELSDEQRKAIKEYIQSIFT